MNSFVGLIAPPGGVPFGFAKPSSAALTALLAALEPSTMVFALAGLSGAQRAALAQAIVASLARQTGASAPVAIGFPFVNLYGFMVIAQ